MQYNLLSGALFETDTTEGNKDFSYSVLSQLINYGDTFVTTLSGSDVLIIEVDLGQRIHVDRFEYKFVDPSSSVYSVASGVEFFYKDEVFDSYSSIPTYIYSSEVMYTTLSGSIFAPRYLKLKHTLADTYGGPTTSGNLYGFKLYNNDTIVDFGTDAAKEEESISIAREATAEIRTIPIYNSGTEVADALISLEPDFSDLDEVISISLSEDGPWVKSLDDSEVKLSSSNFDYGLEEDTEIANSSIRIVGIDTINSLFATDNVSAQYITPVFNKDSTSSYSRIIVDKDTACGGHIAVDADDPAETIEIRAHNTMPRTYAVIRELYDFLSGGFYYVAYRDRWLSDQSIKESSGWGFIKGATANMRWRDYGVVFDQDTERWAGWACFYGTGYYGSLKLFNNYKTSTSENITLATHTSFNTKVNFVFKNLLLDSAGGIWIYFYCQSYSASQYIDATGYYLIYFDNEFTTLFKWYDADEQIGVIDVNYDTKEVWYTRPASSAIYKLDTTGNTLVEFAESDYTIDLGGLAVLGNGNIVFANGVNLHYLHYDGTILEDYTIENVADTSVDFIAIDGDGSTALWVIDGLTVGRLLVSGDNSGSYDFKIDNIGYPIRLKAVDGGVWVECTESEVTGTTVMRFISKENKRVDVSFSASDNSFPALIYQTYENKNYIDKMPISVDSNWSSLAWHKINPEYYLLPEDDYYQLRFTLHRQTPYERWPSFVTDPDQEVIHEDYFVQTSQTPNQLLWGNWSNSPDIDRAHVDTSNEQLILEVGYSDDSFVETNERVLFGQDVNDAFEIIVGYELGQGNGINTGIKETLSFSLIGVVPGYEDYYVNSKIVIPANPTTSSTYIYISIYGAGGSSGFSANLGTGLTFYEGELRMYYNLSNSYIGTARRSGPSGSWSTAASYLFNFSEIGNIGKIKILGNKDSSAVKINYIYVNFGNVYYYTDTPVIRGVYEQKPLELNDIYPNNYKNMYVKAYASSDLSLASNYEMDMKVRWRIAAD